jgi:hypothetical protein
MFSSDQNAASLVDEAEEGNVTGLMTVEDDPAPKHTKVAKGQTRPSCKSGIC